MPTRDPYLDNVKAILIVLVVVGHAIEPIGGSSSAEGLYRFIYLFHMPAFVLVTGYLSRRFRARPRAYLGLGVALLVPYLVFQTVHHLMQHLASGEPMSWDYLNPEWTLWFLLAMFFWRTLTPLLRIIPAVVVIAVLVSLVATGWLDRLPAELALDRTLQLLPFFALGLALGEAPLAALRRRTESWPARLTVALPAFALLAGFAWLSIGAVEGRTAFWNRESAEALDAMGPVPGAVLRPLIMVLGVVGTAAVLVITPRGRHWWGSLGRYSIYVYLLHPVVLWPLTRSGDYDFQGSISGVVVLTMAAVCLAVLLASRPVRRLSRVLVEPPLVEPTSQAAAKVAERLPDPLREGGRKATQSVSEAAARISERLDPSPPDSADVPRRTVPPAVPDPPRRIT